MLDMDSGWWRKLRNRKRTRRDPRDMISAVGEGRVCRSFRLRRRRSPTQQGGEDGVAGEEGHGQRRAGAGAAQKETSLDGERGGSKNGQQ